MNRESQGERFEADSVRRAAVLDTEARDRPGLAVLQNGISRCVEDRLPERVDLNTRHRSACFALFREELVTETRARVRAGLIVEPAATDVGEEHAADASDDPDGRERGLDER